MPVTARPPAIGLNTRSKKLRRSRSTAGHVWAGRNGDCREPLFRGSGLYVVTCLLLSFRRITTLGPPMFHRFDRADGWPAYQREILCEQECAEWQHPEPEDR